MKKNIFALAAACAALAAAAAKAPDPQREIYLGGAPSTAPDGSFFVFDWCNRIWKAPLGNPKGRITAIPLTDGSLRDSTPFVSPDGKRVAFHSIERKADRIYMLELANPANRRRVTDTTQWTFLCGWSPDGKSLLAQAQRTFTRLKETLHPILVSTAPGAAETELIPAKAKEPAISPDGAKVLFSTSCGDGAQRVRRGTETSTSGDIWLYDRKSGKFRQITSNGDDCRSPCWLPDGDSFLYTRGFKKGTRNLFFHRISAGTDIQLTFFKEYNVIFPSVSADGRTVVFRNGLDFYCIKFGKRALADLEKAEASPKDGKARRKRPQVQAVRLRVSPQGGVPEPMSRRIEASNASNLDSNGCIDCTQDGAQFAFTSGGVLWTMDATIRRPAALHDDPLAFCRECAFSPDGEKLYWLADRGDGSEIWCAERKDRSLPWWENADFAKKKLLGGSARRSGLSVSPDGAFIAFADCYGRIAVASAETGRTLALLPRTSGGGAYAWHPSCRAMAVTLRDKYCNSDVWLAPLPDLAKLEKDGRPVEIAHSKCVNVSRHYKYDGQPAFSPDGKVLAFIGDRTGVKSFNTFYAYLDEADERADNQAAKELAKARKETAGARKKESGSEAVGGSAGDSPAQAAKPAQNGKAPGKETGAKAAKTIAKAASALLAGGKDEKAANLPKPPAIDPEISRRVRRIRIETEYSTPLFGPDSRSLLIKNTAKFVAWDIARKSQRQFKAIPSSGAQAFAWLKNGDKIISSIGGTPAVDGKKLDFKVRIERSAADRNELGFRTMWGQLRDEFYDSGMHGADWNRVKANLLPYARHAPCTLVFNRVVSLMNGMLDSSHTGYSRSASASTEWGFYSQSPGEWRDETFHLGVELERTANGSWRVTKEYPDTPLAQQPVRPAPGDEILEIDGTPMSKTVNIAQVTTVPPGHSFKITFTDGKTTNTVQSAGASYDSVREAAVNEGVRKRAAAVHAATGGKVGYIYVKEMNSESLREFEDAVFAEAFGREALIVDVRDNGGGYTTDHLLDFLCGPRHAQSKERGAPEWGYDFRRRNRPPLADVKLVTMANETSFSNAEIFSHAVKALRRGTYVGMPTGGYVIGTYSRSILDYGTLRVPANFWHNAEGIDMENHGAEPDIKVLATPADEAAGRDPQLEAAIKAALEKIEE